MVFTFLSHICSGLLPMLYNIDRNPLWNVFLNIVDDCRRRIILSLNDNGDKFTLQYTHCHYRVTLIYNAVVVARDWLTAH